MDILELIQLSAPIALVVVTLIYVYWTWKIAKTNEKAFLMSQELMERQTRPRVIVYLTLKNVLSISRAYGTESKSIDKQLLYLIIHNVGHEPAHDIYFDILPDIVLPNGKKISELRIFKQHLNLLAPNGKRYVLLGDVRGGNEEMMSLKFRVGVGYFGFKGDREPMKIPLAYSEKFFLDFAEFKDEIIHPTEPAFL